MQFKKSDVGYDEHGGQGNKRCDDCINFIESDACKLVIGEIDVDALCDLYDKDIYKAASINIRQGFLDKMANPQRGRVVADRSLTLDDASAEDPALRKQKARSAHTKSIPEKAPYAGNTYETEKNGMIEAFKRIILDMEE